VCDTGALGGMRVSDACMLCVGVCSAGACTLELILDPADTVHRGEESIPKNGEEELQKKD